MFSHMSHMQFHKDMAARTFTIISISLHILNPTSHVLCHISRVLKARPHTRIICTIRAKNSKLTSSQVRTSDVFTESYTLGVLNSKLPSDTSSVVT